MRWGPGFGTDPQIGRPLVPPTYVTNLEPALAEFDREIVEVDSMLARLGIDASVDTAGN